MHTDIYTLAFVLISTVSSNSDGIVQSVFRRLAPARLVVGFVGRLQAKPESLRATRMDP